MPDGDRSDDAVEEERSSRRVGRRQGPGEASDNEVRQTTRRSRDEAIELSWWPTAKTVGGDAAATRSAWSR